MHDDHHHGYSDRHHRDHGCDCDTCRHGNPAEAALRSVRFPPNRVGGVVGVLLELVGAHYQYEPHGSMVKLTAEQASDFVAAANDVLKDEDLDEGDRYEVAEAVDRIRYPGERAHNPSKSIELVHDGISARETHPRGEASTAMVLRREEGRPHVYLDRRENPASMTSLDLDHPSLQRSMEVAGRTGKDPYDAQLWTLWSWSGGPHKVSSADAATMRTFEQAARQKGFSQLHIHHFFAEHGVKSPRASNPTKPARGRKGGRTKNPAHMSSGGAAQDLVRSREAIERLKKLASNPALSAATRQRILADVQLLTGLQRQTKAVVRAQDAEHGSRSRKSTKGGRSKAKPSAVSPALRALAKTTGRSKETSSSVSVALRPLAKKTLGKACFEPACFVAGASLPLLPPHRG